jgi:hypothetical protein
MDTFDGLGTHSITGGSADTQAPTAPTNLTASNITNTTADLTWTASTDNVAVTSYDIYKGGVYIANSTTNSYNVTGLTQSTTYNFTVYANDAAGNISTVSNTAIFTTLGGSISNVLFSNSFETGWDGWIDGGSDCYRIKSSRSYDGNYSIRIRDNSGTQSAMTSGAYDVSSYDNLEVKFNFYSYSMETNEDFWLQYFDGTSWKTVKAFVSGVDFSNNTFTAETINISSATYNFPVNAKFRFQCDASSNSDVIYIDNISVTASSGVVTAAKNIVKVITNKQITFVENNSPEIEDMGIYPNPAVSQSVLKAEIDIEDTVVNVQVKIMNLQGRLVKVLNFNNVKNEFFEKNLQLTNLESGVYFVNITTNNGLSITKRLIIK